MSDFTEGASQVEILEVIKKLLECAIILCCLQTISHLGYNIFASCTHYLSLLYYFLSQIKVRNQGIR